MVPLAYDEGHTVEPLARWATLRDAALAYASGAALGMAARVFPLAPGTKVPAIPKEAGGRGVHDATASLEQVERWWEEYPEANVGLACGSGLLAVDVDVKGQHDGPASLAEAMRRHGALPDTAGQVTPSGGFHLLYAVPLGRSIRSARHLGLAGVDLQYAGRYVVAAPSQLSDGRPYKAVTVRAGQLRETGPLPRTVAPAPWWLLEPVLADGAPPLAVAGPTVAAREPIYTDGAMGTPEGLGALDGLCAFVARQSQGNVNDALNWAAYQAGGYVAAGHLDYHHAETMLATAGKRAGHDLTAGAYDPRAERAMEGTIASGLGAGQAHPLDPQPPKAQAKASRVRGLGEVAGRLRRGSSRVKGLGRG